MSKLTEAERNGLIDALVTNCGGWDKDDAGLLNNLSDDKLMAHAKGCADMVSNQSRLVANEEGQVSFEDVDDETLFAEVLARTGGDLSEEELGEEPINNEEEEMQPLTNEEWLEQAPPEIQSVVANAINFERGQKQDLIRQITANKRNPWPKEELAEMDLTDLQRIAALAVTEQRKPLYLGAAGGAVYNEEQDDDYKDDILPLPTMNFERAAS